MKKQKNFKLIREFINLILNFFKPFGLPDDLLKIPTNVKKMGFRVSFIELSTTVISLIFAFLLKLTNIMIEHKLILLGLMFFMLYRGEKIVRETLRLLGTSEDEKFNLIFDDELVLRGIPIIGSTFNKVLKYDHSRKLYKTMNDETVWNSIKNYLSILWRQKIQHIFDVVELISIVIMLIAAVFMNTAIPQTIFVPTLIIFFSISLVSSAYISMFTDDFFTKNRELDNEQYIIVNDLLRVPMIVNNDLDMRINQFKKTTKKSKKNMGNFHKKYRLSNLIVTILEVISQYGIIFLYIGGIDWRNIDLGTIAEISATLVIVETALGQGHSISFIIDKHNDKIKQLKSMENDVKLILDVYHKEENKKNSTSKSIENIKLNPFSIQYLEESENDKPFTLTSPAPLELKNGDVVVLYGPSGSGKSTFMKMLTGKIRIEKSTEIPATSRFLCYDETLTFGSLNIFDELFCCTENPDLQKMQEILENLHLWCEINHNCFDVWKWMKEKQFGQSLSNGQKQRLILAKMLYWLDSEIDVMILDECTSGLDDKTENDSADAESILEYIVKYVNSDKQRIVIISTHQNIDGLKKKLENEFTFKNLLFSKEGDYNVVKEI